MLDKCSNLQRPSRVVHQALVGTHGGRGIYGHLIAAVDWALLPVGKQQHELSNARTPPLAQQVGRSMQRRRY